MWFLVLISCQSIDQAEQREAVAEERLIESMDAHWTDAESMRNAVFLGDLKAFHKHAHRLSKRLPLQGVPPAVAHLQPPLEAIATQSEAADSLQRAAHLTGQLAAACGSCHSTAKVVPELSLTLPPPQGEASPQMLLHELAGVKLWASLVQHDTGLYTSALTDLRKASFSLDDGTKVGGKRQKIEQRLQVTATKAQDLTLITERGEAYSSILELCVSCHETLQRDEP